MALSPLSAHTIARVWRTAPKKSRAYVAAWEGHGPKLEQLGYQVMATEGMEQGGQVGLPGEVGGRACTSCRSSMRIAVDRTLSRLFRAPAIARMNPKDAGHVLKGHLRYSRLAAFVLRIGL